MSSSIKKSFSEKKQERGKRSLRRTSMKEKSTDAKGTYLHAMVVLMRPTLVNKASFANSTLNAGVSCIFSFKTLEHLLEL